MTRIKPLSYIVTILIISASVFSFVFFDSNFLIRKWNIPLAAPGFLDTRLIGVASESYAMGFDPLVENPANNLLANQQQLNYPKIWHLLFLTGMDQSHTNLVGSMLVVSFFIGLGLFWFTNKFDDLTYIILSLAVLSSSVMLGIERANIELVLFFIISTALIVNYSSSIKALFLILLASILKMYPIFGIFYLLKENKKKFWGLFLLAISIFVAYLLLTFSDSVRVYATTPKTVGSSFGMNVWWMGLKHKRFLDIQMSDQVILLCKTLSYITVLLISAGASFFSFNNKYADQFRQGKYLDAFRVGAGIYIGCFIVINNSDHRLLFLIFTIPQLVSWLRNSEGRFSKIPLLTLSAMIFSLWSTFIMRFLGRNPTFLVEEFFNWIMLAGLLYLFFASVPDWFSNYLRWPFSRIKYFNIQAIPTDK